MRYTLIEMVQLLLSSLDSDEVNSISDTAESLQVANLLRSVYYDIATDLQLPEHEGTFQLNASGSIDQPVLMTVPSSVCRIDQIRYNTKLEAETLPLYKEIQYLPWDEFVELYQGYRGLTAIDSMTFTNNSETFSTIHRTDEAPTYFSSIDDYTLIFNSLDTTEDDALQKSKTMCNGMVYPTFTLTDNFTPDLNPTQFSYFVNRAKVRAFAELKQTPNQEAASEARIQKIRSQKYRRILPRETELQRLPKYGR